jgi:DNA-binding transcriptional ArsR family regulator
VKAAYPFAEEVFVATAEAATPASSPPGRDEAAVSRFVERFAAALIEAGVPRMPARAFAALLATDSGALTASELAERLRVSAAAVSGAMRYLTQVNLASREREPGSRRDRFRVHGDVWYEAAVHRDHLMVRWAAALREGIAVLGPDSPAGIRMAETLAFVEFVREELPLLLERWRARKAQCR